MAKVTFKSKNRFTFQPTSLWHATIPSLPQTKESLPPVPPDLLSSLNQKASALHSADIRTFQLSSSSTSEAGFLSSIIQSGTLSDRLSALTLSVQSSPVHNTKSLETLKGMAERGKAKGGREESLKALRCVVDWWIGGGSPGRKLKYFRDQPLNHPAVTDEHLLIWCFEDWLKKYFFSILQILEMLSLDPLQYVRMQSLTLIFTLLRDKPEQEQNLLRLLVNKLGDAEKTPCSRASYHLLNLLQTHPSMKAVVVREIIALVLRPPAPPPAPSTAHVGAKHIRFADAEPKSKSSKSTPTAASMLKSPGGQKGINSHARYYAIITLNQVVLTPGDRDVALQLMDCYFEIFKELLGTETKEGDIEDEEDGVGEVRKDKKGRVIVKEGKIKGKMKARQAKGAGGFAEVDDVHSRLVSAILTGVNRALPFARVDAGDIGLNKHIDTLFKITHTSTFNISLQALVLIQQIAVSSSSKIGSSSISKSITDRYYRALYDSLHDTRLASSSKQAMYLNLLFKSIKVDTNEERIKAIVRRFVQILVSGGGGATEFIAGGLYLLGELFSTIPGLRGMINEPQKDEAEAYDPRKRDPRYAHAFSTPLWELVPLLHHYHPAIALHAQQLLTSQPLTAAADLSQNTLSHFLDRFVYKNPKKLKQDVGKAKGASAMQPAASASDGTGVKLLKGEVEDAMLMNDKGFLKKGIEDVPVDQAFYHKYFTRKGVTEKTKAAKLEKRKTQGTMEEDDDDDDDDETADDKYDMNKGGSEAAEDEDSDEDEAEIWKAMKSSMPKIGGMENEDLLEDEDDAVPSGLDISDGDEQKESNHEDEDDGFSLAEGSDDEDLVPLSGDEPDGLVEWDGSASEEESEEQNEEWGGIGGGGDSAGNKKRKREATAASGKSKKLRSLPMFASYDDYAKMIEDGPEDDI